LARQSIATGRGDWDALLAIVDTMLERFPSHAPSLGYRAMALTGLGRFDECLDPPKRALRVGPRDSLVGAWNDPRYVEGRQRMIDSLRAVGMR
jgi:hypothetical protein